MKWRAIAPKWKAISRAASSTMPAKPSRGQACPRVVQIRVRIQAEPLVVWIGFPRKNQSQRPEASAMNRLRSIFSQLLQLFPRVEFQRLVQETKGERRAGG